MCSGKNIVPQPHSSILRENFRFDLIIYIYIYNFLYPLIFISDSITVIISLSNSIHRPRYGRFVTISTQISKLIKQKKIYVGA